MSDLVRSLRLAAAICVIAAASSACQTKASTADTGPLNAGTRIETSDNEPGVRMTAPVGSDRSVGGLDMCTRSGPVTIRKLTFTATGAKVIAAKLYLRGPTDATATGIPSLPPGGTAAVGGTIDRPCRAEGDPTAQEIDVLLRRTDPAEVTGKIKIEYTEGDKPYALTFPFKVIMRPVK